MSEDSKRRRKVLISLSVAAVMLSGSLWLGGCSGKEAGGQETVAVSEEDSKEDEKISGAVSEDSGFGGGLTDFRSLSPELVEADEEVCTVTLGSTGGDHLAVYDGQEGKTNDFILEADIKLIDSDEEGALSAALLFGVESKKVPSWKWYGANIDTARKGRDDLFRLFGPGIETNKGGEMGEIDIESPLHLKLDVKADGEFTYSFGNAGDQELRSITGTIPDWHGGYVGILTFRSRAEFSNISFTDRREGDGFGTSLAKGDAWQTDLADMTVCGGTWEVREEGLYSNTVGQGEGFLSAGNAGEDFVYTTDVKFLGDTGMVSLVFRNGSEQGGQEGYALSLDGNYGNCQFVRWQDGCTYQMVDEKQVEVTQDRNYNLKAVAVGPWISCYVNDELVASTGDYCLQPGNRGQNTCLADGYFGLSNTNGEMVFQNTCYTEINDRFTPLLSDITVTSSTGTVEEKTQFTPTEPGTIQYVGYDAETVDFLITPQNENTAVTVRDEEGNIYPDLHNIPVEEGRNILTVTCTAADNDGMEAAVNYRVDIHRRQEESIYYQEAHRDQYHYSVKDGWANDPNGLVYYNGTYHMFYQFYDDIKWGPMHWAHATSRDLLTWKEEPVTFYPDANGAMFSGCIVADEENTSGLFPDSTGGLVALITADGNGQRIKIAYSEDEGKTWKKADRIVADWTDDPLGNRDFRDPKVFRYEGKWFMVIAGGPLRIYSSDNLQDWKCESTYADLHTECPDLYPLQTEESELKWVLSRGGRFYKIGDFEEVDGNWTFLPDEAYVSEDGVMNFGKDSYAAMTYYVQDFGTKENPTIPDIVELNWMNTWDNYCNLVVDMVGQKFNGTFNLNLKTGLVREEGKYVLTQTPVEAYEALRDEKNAVILENVEVGEENDLLKDFEGECYEIRATFRPDDTVIKLGFNLRVGEGQATSVVYDLENETLSMDRSDSGTLISEKFGETDSQKVTKNTDGTIDLHIYVDRASIEVFARSHTVAGANQIFPAGSSLGAEVFAEGGTARADIVIYPLRSIWEDVVQ